MMMFDSKMFWILGAACLLWACETETKVDYIRTADLPGLELEETVTIRDSDEFTFGRIFQVSSDDAGHIFLPDQQQNKIYTFNTEGKLVETIGNQGSGPGEFEQLSMAVPGLDSSLFTYDFGNISMSRFDYNGAEWEFAESISFDRFGTYPIDILENGELILRKEVDIEREPGLFMNTSKLLLADENGDILQDSLKTFDTMISIVVNRNGGVAVGSLPFGRRMLLSPTLNDRTYMMWNDTGELAIWDKQFSEVDSVYIPLENLPVSSDDRSEALENQASMFMDPMREYMPETKPVAEEMHIDPRGNIWLQTHDDPEYLVVSRDGEPIGSFDVPEEHTMRYVDEDYIYLIGRDGVDQQVVLYTYVLPD